jgi:hypothetical protein
MAVPRPLLLAVLGLLLLSATFMATRASRSHSEGSAPAAQHQSTPKASKPSAESAASSSSKPRTPRSASRSAARPARAHRALTKPAAVSRAIAQGRIAVLAFFQPGADDRANAAAVASLPRGHGVAVFTDRVAHVGRYGPLIVGLGIDQAPAIVIVDRHRNARLIEGYVDSKTLAQEVSDARG